MTNETHLDPSLSLRPVQRAYLNAVTKLAKEQMELVLLRAMEIRRRERDQLSASGQRVFIRVQTKNKHPHSTKKHK
jgi:hypothetical protein